MDVMMPVMDGLSAARDDPVNGAKRCDSDPNHSDDGQCI